MRSLTSAEECLLSMDAQCLRRIVSGVLESRSFISAGKRHLQYLKLGLLLRSVGDFVFVKAGIDITDMQVHL